MDDVLTWDSFDLTAETEDTSSGDGDSWKSEYSPISGLQGYMCALVSYDENNTPCGFATFYLHNKKRHSQPQSSKAAARAPDISAAYVVDMNIVVIPVLMSNGLFRIARYNIHIDASEISGAAWLAIMATYEETGNDGGYSPGDLAYGFLNPVVYYKAF